MKDTVEYFNKNGYVVLQNALSKDQCDALVKHMFDLHAAGALVQDDQCPLSDAVYGDPKFDALLESFAQPLSRAVGKRLLPTYSYARIYRPGDILKKHKDRPACEISTTLTLGYDASHSWPIYFSGDDELQETMVTMEPGEMAAYKGCDMLHWRKPFKGNWHCQVFLHYVDADGPYADQANDGRVSLGVDKTKDTLKTVPKPEQKPVTGLQIQKPVFNSVALPDADRSFPGYLPINKDTFPALMFTDQECDAIIQIAKDSYATSASVGGMSQGRVAKQIRSAEIYEVTNNDANRWIFEKVAKAVSVSNATHFKYEISHIPGAIQLIHYPSDADVPGHYDWHVDAGPGHPATRKISFTAQLSDPSAYTGCDLVVDDHGNKIQAVRDRGSISLFPSYMPHVVTPIEFGDRYALVVWIHGSRRFM